MIIVFICKSVGGKKMALSTSRKVAGSIPDAVIRSIMYLYSPRNIPGGGGGG